MTVHYEKDGAIAVFTLDNGKVNAITPRMHHEFHEHLKDYLSDPALKSAVLTGAGTRAFSGGDDIKTDWSHPTQAETLQAHFHPSRMGEIDVRPGWERELRGLERYKPIVGALNGPALGMGFIFAMNFMDIRVATPGAYLSLPEIAYGMAGAGGSTQLWRHLPPAIAMDMVLTGKVLEAEQAQHFGLYNDVVAPEALMETALAKAAKIAESPGVSIRVEMEGFYRTMDMSRSDGSAFMYHLYRLQRAAYLSQPGTSANPLADDAPEQNATGAS